MRWWGLMGVSLLATTHPGIGGQAAADSNKQEALQELRISQQEQRTRAATQIPKLPDGRNMTYAAVEEMYLTGQISARRLQKYIEALVTKPAPEQPEAAALVHGEALEVLRQAEADPSKNPAPGPAMRPDQIALDANPAESLETPMEKDFADIEAKMDQLLKSRAEREASRSNLVEDAAKAAGAGQTKRQRLDSLLRLYIYGKISEEEYNEQRARLIAEPD